MSTCRMGAPSGCSKINCPPPPGTTSVSGRAARRGACPPAPTSPAGRGPCGANVRFERCGES
eukprot:7759620-Pyramimonas_sp.AAC.1